MATNLKLIAASLKSRVDGIEKDAREAATKVQALGSNIQSAEEVKMATQILTKACNEAAKYLDKAYRGR